MVPMAPRTESPWARFRAEFAESRLAMAGLALLVVILALGILAPVISPQNPYDLAQLDVMDSRLAPGEKSADGRTYWLGTDDQGRDMLSGIFYGLRISLGVGVASTVFALAIGLVFGLVAAYFGGWVDTIIMRVVDIQLSFPAILIALILLAVLGQGVDKIVIALVTVQWAYYARTVRSSALVERQKEYVEAARVLALGQARIVFRHLLPNCLPPLIVVATEFGRPPEFDGRGGRGHQSKAFTCVLAGGGLRMGRAIGVTDDLAKSIVERPVSVPDLHATIHAALGIDPHKELYDGERPVPITDRGTPIGELFA